MMYTYDSGIDSEYRVQQFYKVSLTSIHETGWRLSKRRTQNKFKQFVFLVADWKNVIRHCTSNSHLFAGDFAKNIFLIARFDKYF